MKTEQHPFKTWIKARGLKLGHVAKQLGKDHRTLSRYLKTGTAPLTFQLAVVAYTGGEVAKDAWETVK